MEESNLASEIQIKDEVVEEAATHEAAANLLALKQPMTSAPNCHPHTLSPQRPDSTEVRCSSLKLGHIELVKPSMGQANSVLKNGGKKISTLCVTILAYLQLLLLLI